MRAVMALARQAFELIDSSGSGTLSRIEVITAFRMEEAVRSLLTPLLPKASGGILGDENIKAQMESLELGEAR